MGIAVEHPLTDWAAFDDFRAPDPMTGSEGVDLMIDTVDRDGGRSFVFVDGGEIFQRMFFLRGFENLLVDLIDDRPEVYALRDMVTHFVTKRIERWLDTKRVDCVLFRDDWGSQSSLMVRPDIWRRVFRPAYKCVIDLIHEGGAYGSFHSDGVILEILPDVVEMGWDEVNPQVSAMDLELLGKQYGGKVCVRADIDRQQILPNGSPEEVRALIGRLFDAFGRFNGGYVGWGEMNADVSIANGEAMLATLYGLRY
jgi:uroporphyrinogen decarboxylase